MHRGASTVHELALQNRLGDLRYASIAIEFHNGFRGKRRSLLADNLVRAVRDDILTSSGESTSL
jgi:hypothetical protein